MLLLIVVLATLRQADTMGREGLGGGVGKYMSELCNAYNIGLHLCIFILSEAVYRK